MKIIAVNGPAGGGKTTFENICEELLDYKVKCRSSIDKVKEIAKYCGWDGEKNERSRKFLSDLKTLLTEFNDTPMKDIKKVIRLWDDHLKSYDLDTDDCVFFIDAREPEFLDRLKNELGASTLFIDRNVPKVISNDSDAKVYAYTYDYYIDNNGTLDDLKLKAQQFLDKIKC